jgi:nucleoside-diphosphate-sugar epimerase
MKILINCPFFFNLNFNNNNRLGGIESLNINLAKEISKKNWLCDSNELVKDFNFKPNYELEHGIHETIEWNKQKKQL